jgi:hypothetical protein
MPYNDPHPTDPTMLVGVALPTDADTTEDMAYVFAEEFARSGFNKKKLMRIFKTPFYAGAHRAYLELGEEAIETIVDECLAIWGRVKIVDRKVALPPDEIGVEVKSPQK